MRAWWGFLWLVASALAGAEGDPRGERNLAGASKLPQGAGIAANYPGDMGIAKDAAVIFADNFEAGELGARWDETRNKETVLSLAKVSGTEGGKKSLRVEAHLGKDTGGGMTKWFKPVPEPFGRRAPNRSF